MQKNLNLLVVTCDLDIVRHVVTCYQVVRLREVFPQGNGFALVFDYMLSDLSEVIRNSEKPLTEVKLYGGIL